MSGPLKRTKRKIKENILLDLLYNEDQICVFLMIHMIIAGRVHSCLSLASCQTTEVIIVFEPFWHCSLASCLWSELRRSVFLTMRVT